MKNLKTGTVITKVEPCVDLCFVDVKQCEEDGIFCNTYYLSLEEAEILSRQLNQVVMELNRRKKEGNK